LKIPIRSNYLAKRQIKSDTSEFEVKERGRKLENNSGECVHSKRVANSQALILRVPFSYTTRRGWKPEGWKDSAEWSGCKKKMLCSQIKQM
jgi:hypothetical protein